MHSCKDVRQAIENFLAGELRPSERQMLDQHLLACPDCRALIALHEQLARMDGDVAEPDSEALRAMRSRVFRQTMTGAARLMLHDPAGPKELRARVTSPGGTTHAAITHLEEHGWAETFKAYRVRSTSPKNTTPFSNAGAETTCSGVLNRHISDPVWAFTA